MTATATSAPGDLALGHAIFANGQGGGAPCANCHGRDGLGGGEADAPAILWTTLSRETALRPAYDASGFARALGGTAPGGRSLSRLMPRYDLDAGQLRALMAYLKALPQLQRQGSKPARSGSALSAAIICAPFTPRWTGTRSMAATSGCWR